jgi:GAF domain-containing protein
MRRRSSTGGQPVKARRRKRSTPKRHNAPKAKRNRGVSFGQETVVARLTHERDEALLRETANAEILRLISNSPSDLELVFRAILENATRICNANFGTLFRFDGENFYPAAQFNTPVAFLEALTRRASFKPTPGTPLDHVLRTKQAAHSADMAAEPVSGLAQKLGGARSLVAVPMLKDDALIGAILIYRQEVRPFTDTQIELVKNFATQAVVAIENARLLNELRQRTTDLAELLEQQTAASQVLSIISRSPPELEPVFQAILANATRLCDAKFAALSLYDGEVLRRAASYNEPLRERWWRPHPRSGAAEMVRTKQPVQISDLRASPAYLEGDPAVRDLADNRGARTLLLVPMLKDAALVGLIGIYRREVQPFTEKQIALVQNFAAQAVIAIENTRLLNELRQRTDDLTEALEQQTATSEVLSVISSSPGELEPVFKAMLESATRICGAKFGSLLRFDGEAFHLAAEVGAPVEYTEFYRHRGPFQPRPGGLLDHLMKTKQVSHTADDTAEPVPVPASEFGGARSIVEVPMLKDDVLVGAIAIYRREVRPFTNKQIELLTNFAAQAVIAIENARLLKELRERTNQLEEQSQEVVKLNQQLEQRVADQVGEIERMSRLRRFLPPQVADLIVASGTEKQLESHRREITALFCDLRGFTGFSESSDPEDVMALLRDYHAAIGQIIIKYGGTLERFAGDGVMVIFNDPVPVENPALQAVLMALDMRSAIEALIDRWRSLGHELGFGIGIAHGFATLGTIGFEGRFDYAAIGTVSNVASRLCDEAKSGQILITPRVRLAVDKAVTVEPVGEFMLKGIRRPMTAYNVLAPSTFKPN